MANAANVTFYPQRISKKCCDSCMNTGRFFFFMAQKQSKTDPRAAFGKHRNPLEKQTEAEQVETARENLKKNFSREQFKQKDDAGVQSRETKPL